LIEDAKRRCCLIEAMPAEEGRWVKIHLFCESCYVVVIS